MPSSLTKKNSPEFKNENKKWIETSSYAQVLAYSTARIKPEKLPKSVFDLIDKKWKGRVSFAKNNPSFQMFIIALQSKFGANKTHEFTQGLIDNNAKSYNGNIAQIQSITNGDTDIALVDSRSLTAFKVRDRNFPVSQIFFRKGDIGNVLFTTSIGILKSSKKKSTATKLLNFMLSPAIQQYFSTTIGEFPTIKGTIANQSFAEITHPKDFSPALNSKILSDAQNTPKNIN
ncbi:extracellular solute-binding protein [Candidatus Liberibacter sp.]|uniref:extracellular solute-binding protein n=1 Tax=Candidatus Liberibacter sp. TaxID=34022 RepID=UPI001C714038|nr:extracellular solute-binding protein [Candidatus Liberibacter sp.]